MLLTSSKMFERYIFLSLLLSHRININQEKKTPKFMDSVFFFDRFKNLTTRSHYMPRKKNGRYTNRSCSNPFGKHSRTKKKVNILVVHALPDLEKHRHLKQETPENIQSVHA